MHHMTDLRGNRCVVCRYCRNIVGTDQCVIYGGKNEENLGICRECAKKKGWILCDTEQEQIKEKIIGSSSIPL